MHKVKREISQFMNQTSVKIALVVSLTMLTLLSLLNVVVIERSEDIFVDVVKTVTLEPVNGGQIIIDRENVRRFNILQFNQDGTERPVPLQVEFVKQFQASLLSVSVIAVLVSLVIGYISSQVFARPLRAISNGMINLRNNDYSHKLDMIGSDEFDEVICEFNRLTDQLEKTEELRKNLISDTSHELKTPIAGLLGQLNGVKEGVFEMDEKRAGTLISQVERLSEIVDRLREFSQIQSEQLKMKKEDVNLYDLIHEVRDQFVHLCKDKKMKLEVLVPKNKTISADKHLLSQVLVNLLQNSINYSGASKMIIELKKDKLIFRDNGVGIKDEDKKYIFERFYRVEKSRNRKTGGLGLGLAIVKEIVNSHGWDIVVLDNKPTGVRFEISLNPSIS